MSRHRQSLLGPFYQNHSGQYPVPRAIRNLPIDLLRTSLVTRRPDLVAKAAQEYRQMMASGGEPPTTLPQSAAFGHWNRQQGPSGVHRGDLTSPYASAMSITGAMRQSGTARMPRVVKNVPVQPMSQAASRFGAQVVPQPHMVMDRGAPVARRFPSPPPADAPPPQAFAASVEMGNKMRRDQRAQAQVYAMSEAQASAEAMKLIFRGRGQ